MFNESTTIVTPLSVRDIAAEIKQLNSSLEQLRHLAGFAADKGSPFTINNFSDRFLILAEKVANRVLEITAVATAEGQTDAKGIYGKL